MIRSFAPQLWAMAAALGLAGCGSPPLIQVETDVRPDGSCDRSIWQPKDRLLPDGALAPSWNARWATVVDVGLPPAFESPGANPGDHAYFRARGAFASQADIPEHFRKSIEGRPELGAGELKRTYERRDFGLFVEHRWAETLTNGVTREGFEKARDAFVDLAVPMLADGVRRVYSEEFDVALAVEELQRRGRPLLRDVLDAWYDALAAGDDPKASSKLLTSGLAAAVERAGVGLRDAKGAVVSDEECQRRVRQHLAERIVATFRRKDGGPPGPEQVDAILAGSATPSYAAAWSAYTSERRAEYEAKLAPLMVKMTGYYAFPPLLQPPGPRFAFAVRLPGRVVAAETNGVVEPSGRVVWRFDSGRLFPSGYTMTVRSIDVDAAAQRRLVGRATVADVPTALAVRDLVADEPELLGLLRRACREGDLGLLRPSPDMDQTRLGKLARLGELIRATP